MARAVFEIVSKIGVVLLVLAVAAMSGAVGFFIGLVVFGMLGLAGWPLAIGCFIVAGVFALVAGLATAGFFSAVDNVGEAVGRKLSE